MLAIGIDNVKLLTPMMVVSARRETTVWETALPQGQGCRRGSGAIPVVTPFAMTIQVARAVCRQKAVRVSGCDELLARQTHHQHEAACMERLGAIIFPRPPRSRRSTRPRRVTSAGYEYGSRVATHAASRATDS